MIKKLNIITGLSGAGKTLALKILEDIGFYCVDNLPAQMADSFAAWLEKPGSPKEAAIVMDVRGIDARRGFVPVRSSAVKPRVIYLESDTATLLDRYRVTRRRHPLGGDIKTAVERERQMLSSVKKRADVVVDTSNLTAPELRSILEKNLGPLRRGAFGLGKHFGRLGGLAARIISFGYKFGVPPECDLVFDVRFMKNPNYVKKFKYLTGADSAVAKYIFDDKDSRRFMKILERMLVFLVPRYVREGKNYLAVGVGCTGGHHRSVAVACRTADILSRLGCQTTVFHRDAKKPLRE